MKQVKNHTVSHHIQHRNQQDKAVVAASLLLERLSSGYNNNLYSDFCSGSYLCRINIILKILS